ncbi:MAG: hypothetical protein HQ595_00340 [Candidatus Omnitrophica bacterium]|nr:hypothetical protein [Candidatus Omnitrophota bacterium]
MNLPGSDGERRNINPGLSAVFSFLFSGLGQLYNGQVKKGLALITLTSGGIILTVVGAVLLVDYLFFDAILHVELVWGATLLLSGILLISCIGTYSIFDAYNVAKGKLK